MQNLNKTDFIKTVNTLRLANKNSWSLWFTKQVINSGRKINHNQKLLNELYSK